MYAPTLSLWNPWKKALTPRPRLVHVSPSGIINAMLMNIGLGPRACEEMTGKEKSCMELNKEDRGWKDDRFSLNKIQNLGVF